MNAHIYGHLISDKGAKTCNGIRTSSLRNGYDLIQLVVSLQKNTNQSILIYSYKAQVQVDQRPPPKNRYTETFKIESVD